MVGRELISVIRDSLAACGVGVDRPMAVARALQIDKSLASKVAKAGRAADGLVALAVGPSPEGIRIMSRAVHGKSPIHGAALEEIAGKVRALADSFAEGRSGLAGAIAGWLPDASRSRLKHARQAAYRAQTLLTGTSIRARYVCHVLVSRDDARAIETVWAQGFFGWQRLRPGAALAVGGIGNAEGQRIARLAVDGSAAVDGTDESALSRSLLTEFCRGDLGPLQVHNRGVHSMIVMPGEHPPLRQEVDIVHGGRRNNPEPAVGQGSDRFMVLLVTTRRPAKRLIVDVLIEPGVLPRAMPIARSVVIGLPGGANVESAAQELDQLDDTPTVAELSSGAPPSSVDGVPTEAIARRLIAASGSSHLRERFTGYRIDIDYPMLGTQLAVWLPRDATDAGPKSDGGQ